jgi:predicted ester cyclase
MATRGTHSGELVSIPPSGRSVTMGGIDIVRVAGGKISGFWYAEHLLELVRQSGAVLKFAASYTSRDER